MNRKPKDVSSYLPPVLAATRLLNLVCESIMFQRFGTRVKWELKVSYYHDENFKAGRKQKAVSTGFKASSGDPVPNAIEFALTGHKRPLESGVCQYCGCTEDHACEGGCSWIDEAKTVCSNPDCVAEHERDSQAAEGTV